MMQHIWQNTQTVIQAQVNERTWEQFFRHLSPQKFTSTHIVFEVPDAFFATWFENHYLKYLKDVLHEVAGLTPEIQLVPRFTGSNPANEAMPPVAQVPQVPASDKMTPARFAAAGDKMSPAQYPPPTSDKMSPAHFAAANDKMSPAQYPPPASDKMSPVHFARSTNDILSLAQQAQATIPQQGHGVPPYGAPPSSFAPSQPPLHAPLSQMQNAAIQAAGNPQGPFATPPGSQYAQIETPARSHEEAVLASGLNPRYTFEHYVVGSSNQFCYAACGAVAERPARAYNPLFLFGGVGLGKTHLLHAIGIEVLRRWPQTRITYVSSEEFMNELIYSLRNKNTNAFRTKYRDQCDLLLMDDIQFIAGKDSTQEEFFHTFNALHRAHRQIVITSDKQPNELPGLEERLRSRFGWGLIADIQPPDIETRIAIVRKKADEEHIALENEVAVYLATQIRSNVRELEGSLIRLKAYASLYRKPISLEMAQSQLRTVSHETAQTTTVEHIQRVVADYYDVKVKDLVGRRRLRIIAHPRHIAMYLSRHYTDDSFPEIGKRFGGRDHSTVMNAVNKIEKNIRKDENLKEEIRVLERAIFT